MSFLYYAFISVALCWKWGNWRDWKQVYPSMLFMIMGNLTYIYLTYSKPLWQSGGILAIYPVLDVTQIVLLYSSTVILFFTFYAKMNTVIKRVLYIALWILIYSVLEFISMKTGRFTYHNGWNIWCSVIFNLLMFQIILLHQKKPLLAWLISTVLVYLLLFLFKIPLSKA